MHNNIIKNQINNFTLEAGVKAMIKTLTASALILTLGSCAQVTAPDTRNVNIPSPKFAQERKKAINERPDAVSYLPLGEDVLVPQASFSTPLPKMHVGPFELRGETLGGALQLLLDGTDIPIAFEATDGLEAPITVTNLHGDLDTVISRVCSLADLYCSHESGILVVKETQLFTVSIPPVGDDSFLTNVSGAIAEIVGSAPITDASTRTIVYRASHRTSEVAESYFQRLRSNTALIIFETYIWEVSLDAGNSTGIDWQSIDTFGKYDLGISLAGAANPILGTPVSLGLPSTNGVAFDGSNVFQFISQYGAVKTVSQPQVTVLSGSSARFRVADTQNFVSEITRSVDEGVVTVSTTTDSVDTGFTFDIESSWDNATVYGNIDILLQEVRSIDTFDDNPDAIVQLPQTTERELSTQVRIRPGDSLLIGGLVREVDNFSKEGPGLQAPLFPSSRLAQTSNSELVFLLRPRVVVYTTPTAQALEKLREDAQKDLNKQKENLDRMLKTLSENVPSVIKEPAQPTVPAPVTNKTAKLAPIEPIKIIEKIEKENNNEIIVPAPRIIVQPRKKVVSKPIPPTPEAQRIEDDYIPIKPVF
jgi:hypothetical protein